MKIGIIGNGFVGKATQLFAYLPEIEFVPGNSAETDSGGSGGPVVDCEPGSAFQPFVHSLNAHKRRPIHVMVYDIRPEACIPRGITLEELDQECDLLFFCLPTPLNHDGSCYTNILEDTIAKMKNPFKIIRSTIPVGFSAKHRCYFMPEFLTEANWENDFRTNTKWVVGIPDIEIKKVSGLSVCDDNETEKCDAATTTTDAAILANHRIFQKRIYELITISHRNGAIEHTEIEFCSTNEAEMLKLMKNCFLSAKVSLMNEFYDFCQATKTDYKKVTDMAKHDARMGTSHFNVPGPDGRRGFGGTCFPKDTHSIYCQMEKHGVASVVFPAVLTRNDTMDRKEREWAKDIWRTTIPRPVGVKVTVVFSTGGSVKDELFLVNICRENLSQHHVVILVVPSHQIHHQHQHQHQPNTTYKEYLKIRGYSRDITEHRNFLVKTHDMSKPLFMPHVDDIYYAGIGSINNDHDTDTDTDTKHDETLISQMKVILNITDLWKQHPEARLVTTKKNPTQQTSNKLNYIEIFEEYYKLFMRELGGTFLVCF